MQIIGMVAVLAVIVLLFVKKDALKKDKGGKEKEEDFK